MTGDTGNPLYNLSVRVLRRALEIPSRGLPGAQACREPFDEARGVETSGVVWLTSPGDKNFAHGIRYEPCFPGQCTWAIENAAIVPLEFAFIDLGCGKGRPLIIASDHKFDELIGVEYSHKLCKIAKSNLEKLGIVGRVLCQDAAKFQFPDRDIFIYLNNPFGPVVLRQVLANLRLSKRVVVAYTGPSGDLFGELSWLTRFMWNDNISVYRNF